jgi:hypothetical protein
MASCHVCGKHEAVAVCNQCRRLICAEDTIEIAGRQYCRLCRPDSPEPVHKSPVDLPPKKSPTAWRARYPAIEISIRVLAGLAYVALVGGLLLSLAYILLAARNPHARLSPYLLRSALSLVGAPVGFLACMTASQLLRLLVDVETNTRQF